MNTPRIIVEGAPSELPATVEELLKGAPELPDMANLYALFYQVKVVKGHLVDILTSL